MTIERLGASAPLGDIQGFEGRDQLFRVLLASELRIHPPLERRDSDIGRIPILARYRLRRPPKASASCAFFTQLSP